MDAAKRAASDREILAECGHGNHMGWNPLVGPNEPRFAARPGAGLRFLDMTEAYSRKLRMLAMEAAKAEDFSLEEGVYLAVERSQL